MNGLVVFDLDGTLLCTHHHSCAAAHESLRRLGLPDVSDETVLRLIGETPEVFFRALAPNCADRSALEALFDALEQEILIRQGKLYDGVPELLRTLLREGYLLAICSNGSRAYVETALAVTGIRDCFRVLACAGECIDKSAAVKEMIRSAGGGFAVMVGDGSHDAKAARDNGIPFLAAGYGYGGFDAFGEPEFLANRPAELFALIGKARRGTLP